MDDQRDYAEEAANAAVLAEDTEDDRPMTPQLDEHMMHTRTPGAECAPNCPYYQGSA